MLAGTGSLHGNGALGQPIHESFGTLHLAGIFCIEKQEKVEITISHMPDNRRYKTCFGKVLFRLADAVCKT